MKRNNSTKTTELRQRRDAPLTTPTELTRSATRDIAGTMNAILADVFALYLKTKNFHWHMSGPHFRDYHLLLDEHGDQLFAMTDPIAERIRKIGGLTIKSIGQISRIQRVLDNDADYVDPSDMIAELAKDSPSSSATAGHCRRMIGTRSCFFSSAKVSASLQLIGADMVARLKPAAGTTWTTMPTI